MRTPKPPPKVLPLAPNAGWLAGAPNAGVLAAPNPPNAGWLAGAPKAGVLAAPKPPNAGWLAGAPNAGVDMPKGELAAPKAGVEVAPKAGVLAAPNAGALAPNAGALAPNGLAAGAGEPKPKPVPAGRAPNALAPPKEGDAPKAGCDAPKAGCDAPKPVAAGAPKAGVCEAAGWGGPVTDRVGRGPVLAGRQELVDPSTALVTTLCWIPHVHSVGKAGACCLAHAAVARLARPAAPHLAPERAAAGTEGRGRTRCPERGLALMLTEA
jgi:hypothetical protein